MGSLDVPHALRRLADAIERIEQKLDRILVAVDQHHVGPEQARTRDPSSAEIEAEKLLRKLNEPRCACGHQRHPGGRCRSWKCPCELRSYR